MARELELKLEIDPDDADKLPSLEAFADEPQVQRHISVYFDTAKGKLRRQGWVLRVRQTDEGWVQTIKRAQEAAGLFDREEWESEVQGLLPDLEAIGETPLGQLVGPRQFHHLQPIFRTDVERSIWMIRPQGSAADRSKWLLHPDGAVTIEVSLDRGIICAGDESEPIHELELELKEGEVAALFAAARKIAKHASVRLGVASKSERGFALAGGKQGQPVKAPPLSIAPDSSVADAFAAIVIACLKHFRLNEPLLVNTRDPEAMHQLRVSIRRLRTALWLFRPAARDRRYKAINEMLRKLTRELGAARNIDVILASMSAGDPAWEHLQRDRDRLYTRILKMLDTRKFRMFMFDLVAWTYEGDWRQGRKAGGRLTHFATRRLDRLWLKISDTGSRLASLSDDQRHSLRIDAKKMRYALEFLGGLNPASADAQRAFVNAAEGVQDALGHLNDLATRRSVLSRAMPDWAKEKARCLRATRRHLRLMTKIGPFWRDEQAA